MGAICVADYVAFDLETTGLSPETDEILEIALVRFKDGAPAERWSSLINPGRQVPLKTARLTHIDPTELASSPPFREVLTLVNEFRGDLPLVGHNSGFDSTFLQKHIDGFPGVPLYDTLELSRIVVPGFRSYKLVDLARELGVTVSEAHRAYDDAEVSGVIFALLQSAISSMSQRNLKAVRDLLGPGWVARRMFAPIPQVRSASSQLSLFDEPASPVAEAKAEPVAPRIPALPEGPFLAAMGEGEGARWIDAPATSECAATLAGFAADYALAHAKRLLLLGFPSESIPGSAVRAGSPSNYICLARLEEAARLSGQGAYASWDAEQRKFLAGLFRWVETNPTGSFAELQWGSAGPEVVPEVSCPDKMECAAACPLSGKCFYLAAQDRLQGCAGGILAHASLGEGLKVRLPFDAVLVWSASDLGRSWQSEEPKVDLPALREVVTGVAMAGCAPSLAPLASAASNDLLGAGAASSETQTLASRASAELGALTQILREQRGGGVPGGFPVDPPLVWKDLHALETASSRLREFAPKDGLDSSSAPLVEQNYGEETKRGAVLVRRAVWPAKAAIDTLLGTAKRVVLFSDLTLSAAKSDGGRRILGLDIDTAPVVMRVPGSVGIHQGDPGRVLCAVLDGGRPVSPPEYAAYLAAIVIPLALSVRKGLLVAFPSRALLRDTYAIVQPALEEQGIAVYGHGLDGGHKVVDHLLEDDSVVFGMAGSGLFPGDPVPDCLLLARVPFAPPNALDEIRRTQVSSAAGSFVEVSVRQAALSLRSHVEKMAQAGGPRAVLIADPKVLPRRSNWGAEFMSAFEDLPRAICRGQEIVQRIMAHLKG